jgi:circadian clock protein KaiB
MTKEEAAPVRDPVVQYVLRLFVAGTTTRSVRAIANLLRICEEHVKGCYDLEIIDVYQNPELAKQVQIFAAPTLLK